MKKFLEIAAGIVVALIVGQSVSAATFTSHRMATMLGLATPEGESQPQQWSPCFLPRATL